MKVIGKAFFWLIAFAVLIVINIFLYHVIDGTFAVLIYGDEDAIAKYTNPTPPIEDSKGAVEPIRKESLSTSSLAPKDIFSILVSIEIALLLAAGNPFFRRLFVRFSHPAAGADLNALCVGVGGIGKTTLIRNFYGKSTGDVQKTTKFEYIKLQQPVDNRNCTVSLFDFVGQDFPSLSPAIHSLASRKININLLIIILGLHIVDRDHKTGRYSVRNPSNQDEKENMYTEMIKTQTSQIFTKSTLTMIVNNLPELERVAVVFNQADLLIRHTRGVVNVDCNKLHKTFHDRFKTVLSEIEGAVEVHRNKYKNAVPIEYHVASIKNGIEFSDKGEGPCIKPNNGDRGCSYSSPTNTPRLRK